MCAACSSDVPFTGGVSQPTVYVSGAVDVSIGTFNLSLAQAQMQAKSFGKKVLPNFRRIIAKGFEEGDLHLLSMCEVGSHKEGLQTGGIRTDALTGGVLQEDEYGSFSKQAYVSIWHEAGAFQPG